MALFRSVMIYTAIVLLAFTLAAQAQQLDLQALQDVPECPIACMVDSIPSSRCSPTDMSCMCADASLESTIERCVLSNCSLKEGLALKRVLADTCNFPVRDRTASYTTTSTTLAIVSGVFVIQRIGFKLLNKLSLGADDWLTLATHVFGVPSTVMSVYGIGVNGVGKDIWILTDQQIYDFFMYFYVLEVLYFFLVAILKLAMLFFYLRIFTTPGIRRVVWGTIAVDALFGLTFIILTIFQCKPITFFWKMWDGEHEGQCVDISAIAWSNAAISIVLDLWMLGIPLWQLKTLQLDWKKKVAVGLMFGLGTFVTIVSILRLRSIVTFAADQTNPTWDYYDVATWSVVEINVGIICVCLPTVRLLLVRLFPSLRDSTQNYYNRYASHRMSRSYRRSSTRRVADWPSDAMHAVSADPKSSHHVRAYSKSSVSQGYVSTDEMGMKDDFPVVQVGAIVYHKTFAVEYEDNDTEALWDRRGSGNRKDGRPRFN